MTTNINTTYKQLLNKTKDIIILNTAISIIHWDMETKMPPKAVEQRSLQLALLSKLHHKMSTSPQIGNLLKQITQNPNHENFNQVQKRNIYLIQKNYNEQTALPTKLVTEKTKQQAITVNTWKKAKKTNNYNLLKPQLKKLINLTQQEANLLQNIKQTKTTYDTLIDDYEPNMTTNQITPIFNNLQQGLKSLLEKIQNTKTYQNQQTQTKTNNPNITVPVAIQQKIASLITQTLGYDTTTPNAAGRIDETEHPFSTGYYDDVRITTHYYPNDFTNSIFSILHETGHALYDQNLNQTWKYQPIGHHCSMGIHESQSRFTENIIGRSKQFWTYFLPKLKQLAPELNPLQLQPFIHTINAVQPSKIRIEADEVTYNLHIIIRYQIENNIFTHQTPTNELPELWNQKYRELLGLNIENDSEGVMQDTHWPSGYFGYFPSYTLGNIYSGQFLVRIKTDVPNYQQEVLEGNLQNITAWLKTNIHNQSNLYNPTELVTKITGTQLDAKPYLKYLKEKYRAIYDF